MKNTKSTIDPKLREELNKKPFYHVCALAFFPDHVCQGEINWEHAVHYGKTNVQKEWALVPICEKSHNTGIYQDDGTMQKELHHWIAYSRATDKDLLEMTGERPSALTNPLSKVWPTLQEKKRLIAKYGTYDEAQAIRQYIPPKQESRVSASRIEPFTVVLPPQDRYRLEFIRQYFNGSSYSMQVSSLIDLAYKSLKERIKDEKNKVHA